MAARSSARVSKRARSSRNTRSRSKMSTVTVSASGGVLEKMVEEATRGTEEVEGMDVDADGEGGVAFDESEGWVVVQEEDVDMESQGAYEGKGKGKLAGLPEEDEEEKRVIEDKPFRLFDLPTEIRLEIYRACLTRPYKILLSRPAVEPAPKAEEKVEEDDVLEDLSAEEVQAMHAAGVNLRGGTWHPQTVQQARSVQLASRRRGGSRGAARPTLQASSSSASSQAALSVNTSRAVAAVAPSTARLTHGVHEGITAGTTTISNNNLRRPASLAKRTRTISDNDRRPRMEDPLIVNLLRTTKTVYKEARDVLYSENTFSLDIFTAVTSLAALHQRSRRRIRHVELEIPTYTEILESFSETVRLSLRYCFGLKKLVVHTPFTLPGGDGAGNGNAGGAATAGGNTTVYANGFDILRWLPQGCEVVLEGQRNCEIDAVVGRHMRLAGVQDKLAYARRQLISNEAETST